MLVIMEYGDVHDLLQFIFDVIAFRGGNIFQVDAGKILFQKFYGVDEFIFVFGIENDRNRIDLTESLVQSRFAFHNRHSGSSADITKAEDTGAIRNNGYDIASPGHFQGQVFIFLDFQAGSSYARSVNDGQVMAVFHVRIESGLDHLMFFFAKSNRFFLQFCCIHFFLLKIIWNSVSDCRHVPAIVDFIHFLLQQTADPFDFFSVQILFLHVE